MIQNRKITAAIIFSAVILSGCAREIEYPEGADTLPVITTTTAVQTYYDTSERPSEPVTAPTAVSTSARTEFEYFVSDIDETETIPSVTEPPLPDSIEFELNVSMVPEVALSDYYDRTRTETLMTTAAAFNTQPVYGTQPPAALTDMTSGYSTTTYQYTENIYGETAVTESASEKTRTPLAHPYSYRGLSDKMAGIYDRITAGLLQHSDKISFDKSEGITYDDIFDVYQLIYNDEYTLFYLSPTFEYTYSDNIITSFNPRYIYDKDQTDKMKKELEEAENKLLAGITSSMSDYEAVKYIHDYIIGSCTYSEDDDMNTVYGCLVKKKALCQGYSHAFSYLCSKLGIENSTVLGVANEDHMWNIVKMDGDWYHIDLTWDDMDSTDAPDAVRYDYFALTDARINELRTVNKSDPALPAANGTRYEYYSYNSLIVHSIDEARSLIEREVRKANGTKASVVQFMCSDQSVYTEVTDALFTDGNNENSILKILAPIAGSLDNKINTSTVVHNVNSNTRTVKIILEYI